MSDGGVRPIENAPHEVDVASCLAYLKLTDGDRENIRTMLPVFRRHAQEFVEAFYKHLMEYPETSTFLQDPHLVMRLKRLQLAHFESMLSADYDAEFAAGRLRVGNAHAELGVHPQLFLGAYYQYVQHCLRYAAAEHGVTNLLFIERLVSLWKSVFLDITLTLDAYFGRATFDLRQALEMYWQANAELRNFAEFASHDLRTPLATVANLCDEVIDEFSEQMPAEAVMLIRKARERAYRMSSMIDDLLTAVTRSQNASPDEQVSVENLLAEIVDRIRPQLDQREIEVSLPQRYPELCGDRVRLGEVLYNLLANAAKFIDKRPGLIEVTAVAEGKNRVRFSISDNGPGIPQEELTRIFSAFRRLPMHRDQPGSGLGLYFTKNLVEQMGGEIWVESTLGEGATFFIDIPQQNDESRSAGKNSRK